MAINIDWLLTWQFVEAIATVILAASIFVAIFQLKEGRKNTNAQIAVELYRELRGDDCVQKLRSIYQLKPDDFKSLYSDKKNEIDNILDKFEFLGALVAGGFVNRKLAIEPYGGPAVIRCWYQLFEGYTRLCLDYFHRLGFEVILYKEGKGSKKLVFEELQKEGLRPRSFREIKKARKKARQAKLKS